MRRWVLGCFCSFLACEVAQCAITVLQLGPPAITACGHVSFPNGVVLSDPPLEVNRISFARGDGNTSDMYFPGEYIYSQNGTYTITVTATTIRGESQSIGSAVTITDAGSASCTNQLRITSPILPPGFQGAPYSFQLAASGGVSPYRFDLQGGLPAGLVASPDGFINGASLVAGLFGVTFKVTDSQGNSAVRNYGIFLDIPNGVLLSQAGLLFRTQAGVGTPLTQQLLAVDLNQQTVPFQTSAVTSSGGSWLSVSPQQDTVDRQRRSSPLTVSVNPAGLAQGDYYGRIVVTPQGAANSVQTASIVLSIQSPQAAPPPSVTPTGLVFSATQGGANPAAQTFSVTNSSNQTLMVQATAAVDAGTWLSVTPAASIASGQSAVFSAQINIAGLVAGVAKGRITLSFGGQSSSQLVDVALILKPVGSSQNGLFTQSARSANACTPAVLVLVFTLLGANFSAPAAWPTPIEVTVTDNCGTAEANGQVKASFSNGDPPLQLISQQNGRWSATWAPMNARTAATQVTANATTADGQLKGNVSVGGNVPDNPDVPFLAPGGVVSSASYQVNPMPSPDEIISVFGLKLASNTELAGGVPLPQTLQGASLIIGGELTPLVFVSDKQVNAILPSDLKPGVRYQLIAQNGTKLSVPQTVFIAPAEPGIFTTDVSGRGQGHVYVIPQPGEQILADRSRPARSGDILTIYCTGLGSVDPPSIAGTPAPLDQLETATARMDLQIGGKIATVLFAGLTPGFTGLYQVNAIMPDGVEPGDNVPVVLSAGGALSNTVTISAR